MAMTVEDSVAVSAASFLLSFVGVILMISLHLQLKQINKLLASSASQGPVMSSRSESAIAPESNSVPKPGSERLQSECSGAQGVEERVHPPQHQKPLETEVLCASAPQPASLEESSGSGAFEGVKGGETRPHARPNGASTPELLDSIAPHPQVPKAFSVSGEIDSLDLVGAKECIEGQHQEDVKGLGGEKPSQRRHSLSTWNQLRGAIRLSAKLSRMQKQTAIIRAFVPLAVQQDIVHHAAIVEEGREELTLPPSLKCKGTVLFADASGFSALAERLEEKEDGAEQLSRILNSYLGKLLELVTLFGGDVVKFSGNLKPILPVISHRR